MIIPSERQASRIGRMQRTVTAYQFGGYLLPRVQYSGNISWKYRDTRTDNAFLVDGVVDSSIGIGRSPLSTGEMTWSGKYAQTYRRNRLSSCLAQSELSGILSQSGYWKPLVVFVGDDGAQDCADCAGYLPSPSSGVWMWTYAKMEEPSLKGQIDDVLKGAEGVELKFVLSAPFVELARSQWRFGGDAPIRQFSTIAEMEQFVSAGNTRHPNQLPDCADDNRWHYHDPLSCINPACFCFYDADCFWGSTNYRLMGTSKFAVNVPGTFEATGYIKAETDATTIRIINETYFVQEVTLSAKDTVDLDKQAVYSQCTPKALQISKFPRITPGINRLECVSGRAIVGIKPRWLL